MNRLSLWPEDFWVVDKQMTLATEGKSLEDVDKLLSDSVLKHCPQAYPFKVRAKKFKHVIEVLKNENGGNAFGDEEYGQV